MNVLITLSTAGASTGPTFNLYSDVDTYATPFETGVAKSALLAGYTSTVVPDAATMIRVQSVGACTNYGLFSIAGVTTTTTTTSGGGGTTTTTTTPTPTTTTTTTGVTPTTTTTTTSIQCYTYNGQNNNLEDATIFWTNCDGSPGSEVVAPNAFSSNFCAREGSVSGFNFTIDLIEPCGTPPTTTTTTTSGGGTTTTTTSTTATPIQYAQYTLCTDFNVKYYIVGTGVGSTATIAGQCYQSAGTTFTPEGTEFFASDGPCECP